MNKLQEIKLALTYAKSDYTDELVAHGVPKEFLDWLINNVEESYEKIDCLVQDLNLAIDETKDYIDKTERQEETIDQLKKEKEEYRLEVCRLYDEYLK
jgi:hypothetical protein